MSGFLNRPYATIRLAERETPHWQCTSTRFPADTRSSMSFTSRSKSGTISVLCSHGMWMYSGSRDGVGGSGSVAFGVSGELEIWTVSGSSMVGT